MMISTLYEQDYYLWLQKTASLLREGQFQQLDLSNLIEEIESMSRSEKRAVYSNLKILLMHLLNYKYQPENRSNSWRATIVEHRQRIKKAFQDSPSLKFYLSEIFDECYQDAKELAVAETGLAIEVFPDLSPLTPAQVLNPNYLPEVETSDLNDEL